MSHQTTLKELQNYKFEHTMIKHLAKYGYKRIVAIVENGCVVYEVRYRDETAQTDTSLEEAINLYNSIIFTGSVSYKEEK